MKNNKKGFTLVELLAVIVILGVLLVVAVPAVNNIMKTSKEKAAKDNALMVIKALETCNMATQTYCSAADVANYMESSGGTLDLEYDSATGTKLVKFEISGFNGYTITITGSDMSTGGMKAAVNAGTFSGTTLTTTA